VVRILKLILLALICASCNASGTAGSEARLDAVAEQYVRLALALGEHDGDYVDAYYGPAEWRDAARENAMPLDAIAVAADQLVATLEAVDVADGEQLLQLRHNYLLTHLRSLAAVSRIRNGLTLSFDEESRQIYGFVAPGFSQQHYKEVLARLDALLPGEGPTHERYKAYREQIRIPDDKVQEVVRKGLEECRRVTKQHMKLPEGENFELEFVADEPWGAYNWYRGGGQGLIQVNIGRPKYLGTSIQLGCHEGYPGHHAYSSLLDKNFLQDRGWIEFSVLPLFSPQGIIFEGSGDLAELVAFPGAARDDFLRDTIVPIAGLETVDFETLRAVREVLHDMRYAGIDAARNYLDGVWSKAQTTEWLTEYGLVGPEDMDAWFGFTHRYRAYRINYVLGEDLVLAFVRQENPDADAEGDWRALEKLLSLPPAPRLFTND
jgi:hypothetical protein